MLDFQVSCRTMHLNFNSFKLECVLQQQIADICQICALSNNLNKGDGKPCGGIQPAQQLFWNLLLISNIANIQYCFRVEKRNRRISLRNIWVRSQYLEYRSTSNRASLILAIHSPCYKWPYILHSPCYRAATVAPNHHNMITANHAMNKLA